MTYSSSLPKPFHEAKLLLLMAMVMSMITSNIATQSRIADIFRDVVQKLAMLAGR